MAIPRVKPEGGGGAGQGAMSPPKPLDYYVT